MSLILNRLDSAGVFLYVCEQRWTQVRILKSNPNENVLHRVNTQTLEDQGNYTPISKELRLNLRFEA